MILTSLVAWISKWLAPPTRPPKDLEQLLQWCSRCPVHANCNFCPNLHPLLKM
jgi:hypothetical protein